MAIKIRLRGDTAANWVSADPVLDERELGIETDTDKAKLGDGVTAWSALPYWNTDGVGVPVGGSAGQLLAKVDATDFNTEWIDPSNVPPTITPKSGNYTLVESDNGDIIEVDATAAPVTITLPAGLSDGFQAMIVKVDASANAVTLADDGTSSVVGKGTQLTGQHDVATIYRKSGDVYRAVGDVS